MSTLRIKKKVTLFDLDGVVFDTEPLYTEFWKGIFDRFLPGNNQLEYAIKGQTLVEIYDKYFPTQVDKQQSITQALNDFEQQMPFKYVAGFLPFIEDLKRNDIKTAVVTSSRFINNILILNLYSIKFSLQKTSTKVNPTRIVILKGQNILKQRYPNALVLKIA